MYCINPDSDEPIFCLWEAIGVDEENPTKPFVDGNQFARELLYMDGEGKKRIQIWINSEGGSIKDGFSICSAILKTKTKIDTLNVGIAYSMAGVIALMGRKKEGMDFSSYMLHLGYNPDGSEDKGLDVLNKSMITAIATRTGKSEEVIRAILTAETFYTASEAKEAGLIDEVIDCNDENKPRQLTDKKALKEFAHKYLAKAISPKTDIMNKKDICKLLGLDENVSDEVATKALEAHIAKGQAAINALAKAKEKKDEDDGDEDDKKSAKKMKSENEEMKKKLAAIEEADKAQAKSEEDTKKAQALEAFKTKAKTDITAKALTRNIVEAKEIDRYVALAGTSEESLKTVIEAIEAIQVVKTAAKLGGPNEKKGTLDEYGIALIEDGDAVDAKLSPIAKGAGDTKAMVQSINSFDYQRDWVNRKRK